MRLSSRFEDRSTNTPQSTKKAEVPRQDSSEPALSPAARNLALAYHIERLIERGVIADYTQAARMLGVSQPRMTHLMGLILLAPAIQESILLGKVSPRDKELRGLARVAEWQSQGLSVGSTDL